VIRCNIGEPDFPMPDHVREEVKRYLDAGATGYSDPQGILPLRQAIAEDVGQSRGIDISADRVVVFPGANLIIGLCVQTYCDADDEVIYPSPGFPVYETIIRYEGARLVPLHLREENGFAMTAEALEPLITDRTRLIFLNSPSNPTGGVMDRTQLDRVAELILRKAPEQVRIFSDEIYEKVLFDDATHSSIASIPGMAERTIIVSGVSKSYAWPSGRIGWAVFPTAQEAAVFRNLNINYTSSLSAYNQYGAISAIQDPRSDTAVARMVSAFQQRRNLMVERLNAIPGITCQRPGGAFYVFPNISGACREIGAIAAWEGLPADDQAVTSPSVLFQLFLLLRYGVATLDRRTFGKVGSEGEMYLRFSIATGLEQLAEAADRLELAVRDPTGFAEFIGSGEWRE
jgi:aspartate aminotransferase